MKMVIVAHNQCVRRKDKRCYNIFFHIISQVLRYVDNPSLIAHKQDSNDIQKGSSMGLWQCRQWWRQQEQYGSSVEKKYNLQRKLIVKTGLFPEDDTFTKMEGGKQTDEISLRVCVFIASTQVKENTIFIVQAPSYNH